MLRECADGLRSALSNIDAYQFWECYVSPPTHRDSEPVLALAGTGMSRSPGCRLCSLMNRQSTNATKFTQLNLVYNHTHDHTFPLEIDSSVQEGSSLFGRTAQKCYRSRRPQQVDTPADAILHLLWAQWQVRGQLFHRRARHERTKGSNEPRRDA